MENNIQNKMKFFAQYWGQRVKKDNTIYDFKVNKTIRDVHYLELTPLHLITDEDALMGSDLLGSAGYLSKESRIHQFKQLFESPAFWNKQTNIPLHKMLVVFDFLRLKSYAIDFNGLSVSEQVERGWVVLKTKI